MIYCAANHASVWKLRREGWPLGWCMSPGGYRSPVRGDESVPFMLDNGLFHAPDATPKPESARTNIVELVARCRRLGHNEPCFGVVVPDVPYNGEASKAVSDEWLPVLRKVAGDIRCLIAVQDGMTYADAENYDGVFVAGSTEWKEATMAYWCRHAKEEGKWAHVARVNSADRLLRSRDAGADSADGTCIGRGDKTQLKRLLDELAQEPIPFRYSESTRLTPPTPSPASPASASGHTATPTTFASSSRAASSPTRGTACRSRTSTGLWNQS